MQRAGNRALTEVDDRPAKDTASEIGAQPSAAASIEERETELAFMVIDPALADARYRPLAHQGRHAGSRDVQKLLDQFGVD